MAEEKKLTVLQLLPALESGGVERGTLEVGKYADLVVLEEDPMKVDPTRLSQIKVRETWVEGEKRFSS